MTESYIKEKVLEIYTNEPLVIRIVDTTKITNPKLLE